MQINELIIENAIITELSSKTKLQAIDELLSALVSSGRLNSNKNDILASLTDRENTGTTGIGSGVAIPHACSSAILQTMIAIGKSKEGIDFGSPDRKLVHLIFLLLGPVASAGLHLRILARISHLLNTVDFVDNLLSTDTKTGILEYIKKEESVMGEIEPPEGLPSVCVAGAGNGGLAMAAHLSLLGCKVNLFNRSPERLMAVKMNGGISVTGELNGFAKLNTITSDPQEAVDKMDLIMIVVPATAHRTMANLLGPYLADGQIVILNPGRTGGALEFSEVLRQIGIKAYPFIAEAETLLYACRITNPAQVKIFAIKNSVPVATLPAYHIPDVLNVVRKVLPQFAPGDNVLKTSLSNVGSVFHPALTILNTAWIEERHGDFDYYHEGASPSVARVLEAIDAERVAVADAIGIKVATAREWLYLAYGAAGNDLYSAMQANIGYSGVRAPNTIDHRYITEEVPTSLVPIASLGDQLGVPVPTIKAIIHLANILHKRDYWAIGRTSAHLGLAGLSVQQIRRLVEEGKIT